MSVNFVFGENLRLLCQQKPSISSVARDLGIGKVQFHRYLSSQSFPKPNVLAKICDYFDVNANIMLESLIGESAQIGLERSFSPNANGLVDAFSYVSEGHDLNQSNEQFPNGLYANWRKSLAHPGKFTVSLLNVKQVGSGQVMRGFDAVELYMPCKNLTRRSREYRGIILKQGDCFTAVFIHAPPIAIVSTIYLKPEPRLEPATCFQGSVTLAVDDANAEKRLSRSFLVKLEQPLKEARELRNHATFFDKEHLPKYVTRFLCPDD
ncbi:MAG: helix-turn-helix transcriptional regulator [Planktotalea sp.]|uniref:helix-turn-helix domain-containing protein n=1 Tax=Planktotalea sp. TaxID=2029877 RepID=UPI003C73941F